MPALAEKTLKKFAPTFLFNAIRFIWRKTILRLVISMCLYESRRIDSIYTRKFLAEFGYNVIGGPFKGLRYVEESAGNSSYILKLIGIYEEILHRTIESAIKRNYTTIIDIGCAEGYYLVGLGCSIKNATLVGYDIDRKALSLTKKLYSMNNLSNNILLLDDCSPSDLNQRIDDHTFLLCDAEGFEYEILDPICVPSLSRVETFVIELHDFVVPHVKESLVERFKKTHNIEVITFKNGDPENYLFLKWIKNKKHVCTLLLERYVQDQQWLIMERK